VATSRPEYSAIRRYCWLLGFAASTLPVAGCATLPGAFEGIGAENLTSLVEELDTTLEAFEAALLPDDASTLQILAFEALQVARRLLIDQILQRLIEIDPDADLSVYQNRINVLDLIEPEPD